MNFLELQDNLATELNDSGHDLFSHTNLKFFLNQAQADLSQFMARYGDWNQTSTTISAVDGTQEYDLPEKFGAARKVYIDDDNFSLDPIPWTGHIIEGAQDDERGYPTHYYLKGAYSVSGAAGTTKTYVQIGFKPIPDRVLSIIVDYTPIPTDMSYDTDVSIVPVHFHDLILLGAARKAFRQQGLIDLRRDYSAEINARMTEFAEFLAERHRGTLPKFVNTFGDQW